MLRIFHGLIVLNRKSRYFSLAFIFDPASAYNPLYCRLSALLSFLSSAHWVILAMGLLFSAILCEMLCCLIYGFSAFLLSLSLSSVPGWEHILLVHLEGVTNSVHHHICWFSQERLHLSVCCHCLL